MAWSAPRIGALAEVASGNLTLAEPAGIQQGELMIACIGYRSNAPFTIPNDWNLVATQQQSGDTDATNGIASGLMMWCVRGASAPTLTFARTGGDVAQGRILVYPGGSATAPFDVGSANTLGVDSTTVTTASLTTAQAGELIVAMTSHGDNLTASAFDAATDPATASGAIDTTTAPTNGTWIERADNGTNTGADHGLAIADAVRATAGSTGTIQATISAAARHVMIAAAFKLAGSSPSPSLSPSASVSPSPSVSPSSSVSPSVSPSASVSPSSSESPSLSPSSSASPSSSTSPSISPSSSPSPSSSVSLSVSPSPSVSPSSSESPSISPSSSASPSSSPSPSVSPSSSPSPSASESPSVSPSSSESPSSSVSPSVSPSSSASPSISPSASLSPSASQSPSASESPSASLSPSSSPSASTSPSPPPPQPDLIFLDPGGDAVQAPGYFNTPMAGSSGAVTFDSAQKVVGVGSYKFDSEDGEISARTVPDVLGGAIGATRRISTYFRYDSVPDAVEIKSEFVGFSAVYSSGGYVDVINIQSDDGAYATATPARNAGQGNKWVPSAPLDIPPGAIIDSVKLFYERKYDVNTSIGISRVKWEVDGEEGPNHDNTDMPLTDTVVEVDVTGDRAWEWQHFSSLKVITEARRGDTDTAHTQSWDYVKVEVQYRHPPVILQGRQLSTLGFRVALRPYESGGSVLRLIDSADQAYDGITNLAVNTWNRISVSYALVAEDELGINLYVNNIPELSIVTAAPESNFNWPLHLDFGWVRIPGEDHLCWFDQLAIDDGDDLQDIGNIRSTAKLPASVNENNWDTTGGTGAVNERPLSETNYMQDTTAFSGTRQTYTLQTAAVGDVDISGESLIGSMGWVWGRISFSDDVVFMVFNGVDKQFSTIDTAPSMDRHLITSPSYPSNAAGIGMISNPEVAHTFLYECGAVVAYEGPLNPDILLERTLLDTETLPTITDDLRADPPDSYEVCCTYDDFDGTVEIVIHSLDQDGGSVSYQGTLTSKGRTRIAPGVEVYLDVTVTGVTNLQIWRRLNVD